MNWNNAIKMAADGDSVLIVGDGLMELSTYVGKGSLHVRTLRKSGLKSVAVNVVWFIGDIPDEIKTLCLMRTYGSLNPKVYTT
jgi:hypothetical protein